MDRTNLPTDVPSPLLEPLDNMPLTPDVLTLLLQMQQSGLPDARDATVRNRGAWTQPEDELLVKAVSQLGCKKWTDVAQLVPNRTSKQCRERWCNRLAPNVKHEPFELWEDVVIVEKQKELGNCWSAIARLLPGRAANAVKNRWYSGLKAAEEGGCAQLDFGQPLYPELMAQQGFARTESRDQNSLGNDL
jgi:hypothetical protein